MFFWFTNLKTALSNIGQSKWRSFLTMLGIIIGVTSVTTIISLGEGLKQQINNQINQLGSNVLTVRSGRLVNKEGEKVKSVNLLAFLNASTLTSKDIEAIEKLPTVSDVVPINFVTSSAKAEGGSSDNLFVVGTSPELSKLLHQKTQYGGFFNSDGFDQNYATIGSNVAHDLFGEVNPVGQSITVEGQDFVVIGVLKPTTEGLLTVAQTDFNSAVFIPNKAAEDLTDGRTNILQLLIRSNSGDIDSTVQEVRAALLKTHNNQENFSVLKQEELLDIAGGTVDIISDFVGGIAAITLLVGGLSIMNIMWVSVSERTREIGIRKALGATNRQILNQFLMEGSTLSIVGGVIGVLISLLIVVLLRLYTHLEPVLTLPTVLLAMGVSVIIGVTFSIAPALKAARKAPIDALRGE